jgi:cob(I)alamin adenosyltransferase
MKVYTRAGDDGTTGLFYGGRVAKDAPRPTAYGAVDEAQAAIGMARAECRGQGELDRLLVGLCHDLYVAMAELATLPENHHKLKAGQTLVTADMVTALERVIDEVSGQFEPPTEFVVPGANPTSAALDVARTVVRRAERDALAVAGPDSQVVPFLNRLSDLLWVLARWQENEPIITKTVEGTGDPV